jgi:hypothetical protein
MLLLFALHTRVTVCVIRCDCASVAFFSPFPEDLVIEANERRRRRNEAKRNTHFSLVQHPAFTHMSSVGILGEGDKVINSHKACPSLPFTYGPDSGSAAFPTAL